MDSPLENIQITDAFHNAKEFARGKNLSDQEWQQLAEKINATQINIEILKKCAQLFATKRMIKLLSITEILDDMIFNEQFMNALKPKDIIRVMTVINHAIAETQKLAQAEKEQTSVLLSFSPQQNELKLPPESREKLRSIIESTLLQEDK